MLMENEGSIIANDISLGRISILSANLQRCGVMNAVVTRHPGNELVRKLSKLGMGFDKILVDAPCSGEGNIRCSPRTYLEWSEKLLKSMSRRQKKIVSEVVGLLADSGEMVYSTCTHAPEENEEVVQYLLDEFDLEIVGVDLPLKVRPGLLYWRGKKFDESMKGAVRIYHHDNDMEGFFLCKLRRKGKV
jgi:16S rRNA C967 or C1407 C5-methylase (RsmB/RsmF family)